MRARRLGAGEVCLVWLFKSGARRAARMARWYLTNACVSPAGARCRPISPAKATSANTFDQRARQFDAEGRQLELQRFGAPEQQAGQRGSADGLGHVRRRQRRAGLQRQIENPSSAYSVEKLCFEGATNASGPLERSQSCAHGGVPATHHLSPTSRCGARRVARDPTLSTAQQSRRIRRPSEIEFFNGGHQLTFAAGSFPASTMERAAASNPYRCDY